MMKEVIESYKRKL